MSTWWFDNNKPPQTISKPSCPFVTVVPRSTGKGRVSSEFTKLNDNAVNWQSEHGSMIQRKTHLLIQCQCVEENAGARKRMQVGFFQMLQQSNSHSLNFSLNQTFPVGLLFRVSTVEPPRTDSKLPFRSLFTLVRCGSVRLKAWVHVLHYDSNRFGRVEPPRTREKLPYNPCSRWSSVVRGGSVRLNHTEVMSNFIAGLDPCVVLRFEQVRKSRTILIS